MKEICKMLMSRTRGWIGTSPFMKKSDNYKVDGE